MSIKIVIRLIKSFEYRNIKIIPINIDDDNVTFAYLCQLLRDKLDNSLELSGYKLAHYDSYNIHYQKFGAKSNDPVINHQNPIYALKDHENILLKDLEIMDEYELSFFNIKDYENYKANPQRKW
jgi:hypothetical protein